MKGIMMKGMNTIMLDCDHATYLVTKKEFEKLKCMKRIQLKMHLATCKLCRAFTKQSSIINMHIDEIRNNNGTDHQVHLTLKQKEDLQEVVETTLQEK